MSLKKKGYDIRVLNIKDKWRSDHYNPLKYIRKLPKEAFLLDLDSDESRQDIVQELMDEGRNIAEDDVMNLINTIMENTKSETIESNTGDPFWERQNGILTGIVLLCDFQLSNRRTKFQKNHGTDS